MKIQRLGGLLLMAFTGTALLSCSGWSKSSAKSSGYGDPVYGMLAITRLESMGGNPVLYQVTCIDNSTENGLTQAQLEANEVCRRGGTQQDPNRATFNETIVVRTMVATRLKLSPNQTLTPSGFAPSQQVEDSCQVASGEEIHATDVVKAANGHIQFKVFGAPPSAIDCFNRIQSQATNGLFYIPLSDVDKSYEPIKSISYQQ
jgi:hypothetical protein